MRLITNSSRISLSESFRRVRRGGLGMTFGAVFRQVARAGKHLSMIGVAFALLVLGGCNGSPEALPIGGHRRLEKRRGRPARRGPQRHSRIHDGDDHALHVARCGGPAGRPAGGQNHGGRGGGIARITIGSSTSSSRIRADAPPQRRMRRTNCKWAIPCRASHSWIRTAKRCT